MSNIVHAIRQNECQELDLSHRVESIVNTIKGNNRALIDIDVREFFNNLGDDTWIPNPKTRIQVRNKLVDEDFVDKRVNYVMSTGDDSQIDNLVLIYDDRDSKWYLLDGNHTVQISLELALRLSDKYFNIKAYVVHFKELDYDMSYAYRLGNKLNVPKKVEQEAEYESIQNELYMRIEKTLEIRGVNPHSENLDEEEIRLTSSERDDLRNDFIKAYPQVSPYTIGQWFSHHNISGGRRNPLVTYTKVQQEKITKEYIKSQYPEDVYFIYHRTANGMSAEGFFEGIRRHCEEKIRYMKGEIPNFRTKVVVVVRATGVDQVPNLKSGKVREDFEETSKLLRSTLGIDFIYEELAYE